MGAGEVAYIRNISVRELPGNHASQATSTARPTLQAEPIAGTLGSELITNGTFDSDVSGWSFQDNATASAVGGEMEVTLAATTLRAAYQDITTVTGKWYLITLTARSASGQITAGAYTTGFGSLATEIRSVSGSDVSFSILYNATVSTTRILVVQSEVGSSETYYVDNVSVKEVLTWADPKYYLDFDGVDDYLGPVTFASAQAQPNTIGAAIRNDFPLGSRYIYDGASIPFQSIYTNAGNMIAYAGVGQTISTADTASHITVVEYNTTNSSAKLDGVTAFSGLDLGTDNYTGVTLGARFNGGSNYNGRIYGYIGVSRILSPTEISTMETYLANKSGVTL